MSTNEYKDAGDDLRAPTYSPGVVLTGENEGFVFGGMNTSGQPHTGTDALYPFRITTTFDNWPKFTTSED